MRILFVHQNFPAQFRHLATALAADPSNEVVAIAKDHRQVPDTIRVVRYDLASGAVSTGQPLANDFAAKMARAEAVARLALGLRQQGFVPDIICGHSGWGETLLLKDIWPDAPMLCYHEFFFRPRGSDFGFDPEVSANVQGAWRLRAKNAALLLSMEAADWGLSPTEWQWSQLPAAYRDTTSIIHEGIDTASVRPDPNAQVQLGRAGVVCRPGDEVVTFVNRNFEPYRGFDIFMRALPEILGRRPQARIVLVGADGVSYGRRPPTGETFRSLMLKELGSRLDMTRIHFVGTIPHRQLHQLFQVSAAHVYLTYPFVLSWSMLEAMAAGCLIVGSRTKPVEEVVKDGQNGVLVDFFSPEAIADAVVTALERPDDYKGMRKAARDTIVQKYDLRSHCLPAQIKLIRSLAN